MANRKKRRGSIVSIEQIEPRVMLSATPHALAKIVPAKAHENVVTARPLAHKAGNSPAGTGATSPTGFTPNKMREAYGLGPIGATDISFPNGPAEGAGETIAVIDAYDDPTAASDLAAFDTYWGIDTSFTFTKLNENGGTTTSNLTGGDWDDEISLDIEWAHVMAPAANIILYEAASTYDNDLFAAVATADKNPAVNVVSMSFSGGDSTGDDQYLQTPGITYLAATGDSGGAAGYPANSPYVVAVGGTHVHTTNSNGVYTYSSEDGWTGSAGGVDSTYSMPSYQKFDVSQTVSTTYRAAPDMAMDGDPASGVPIYDSTDDGASTPWLYTSEGGTSLSTPLLAGLIADADQGRAAEKLPSLSGYSQTLPRIYQMPSTAFHDVTDGSNNSYTAAAGYDLVTGRGSANTPAFLPDIAGAATVTGRLFADTAGTGTYTAGETVFANQTVYLDYNNDGVLDNNEATATTNAVGVFSFSDVPAGGTVRLANPTIAGYFGLSTGGSTAITYGATDTVNFTYFPTTFTTAASSATYTLQRDPTGTIDQIFTNGVLTDSIPVATVPGLTFNLNGTGESFIVNGVNGNPVPAGGLTVNGTATGQDTLTVIGTTGNDTIAVSAGAVAFSGTAITDSNIANLLLNPGAGNDVLSVLSGSATLTAAPANGGMLTRKFSSVSIGGSGKLTVATAANHSDRTLVITSALNVSSGGTIDLGGNDMVIKSGSGPTGSLSSVNGLAASGYSFGNFNGRGLISSAAAADPTHLTALGVAPGSVIPAGQAFDGYSPAAGDVLVKFTYVGDTNLDGKVDGSDYSAIDANYGTPATGWAAGDFNYDQSIDGTDYSLIDNAYNNQGAQL